MSTHRPLPSPTYPSAPRTDENQVVTVIAGILLGCVLLGTATYQYLQYSQAQEQANADRKAYQRYNDHLQSSQPPAPITQPSAPEEHRQTTSPDPAAQQATEQKLLNHPAVTPGPGFHASGVKQTGEVIIDALDRAQQSFTHQRP